MNADFGRVVALGASNLTLGLETLLSTVRGAFPPEIEVLAALGYGRSYGAMSSIAGRRLPGILQSGLWEELGRLKETPTLGLITDVGNDILYGVAAARIIAWVEEAADRLARHANPVIVTGLPTESIRGLSPSKFRFFRSLFFPPCRLSREAVVEAADEVNEGMARLAVRRGLRFQELRRDWYSFDPIHIRPEAWRVAWREIILAGDSDRTAAPFSTIEWARLHTLPPAERWLLGFKRTHPQRGWPLRHGTRLWLY